MIKRAVIWSVLPRHSIFNELNRRRDAPIHASRRQSIFGLSQSPRHLWGWCSLTMCSRKSYAREVHHHPQRWLQELNPLQSTRLRLKHTLRQVDPRRSRWPSNFPLWSAKVWSLYPSRSSLAPPQLHHFLRRRCDGPWLEAGPRYWSTLRSAALPRCSFCQNVEILAVMVNH